MLEKDQNDELQKTEGTVYFYAPEMCQKDNPGQKFAGKPLDVWALGVTLYLLTFNRLPLKEEEDGDLLGLFDIIAEANIKYPEEETRKISEELRDLFSQMLEKDPAKRWTTQQLRKHPWVNKGLPDISEETYKVVEVTDEEIKNSLKIFFTLQKTVKFT